MKQIYLSKIEPESNTYKFYRLLLPPGSKALLVQWGRIGDYVTEKWAQFATAEAAQTQFGKLDREKRREGYRDADQKVMPKNYLFYQPPTGTVKPDDGQLSFLGEEE